MKPKVQIAAAPLDVYFKDETRDKTSVVCFHRDSGISMRNGREGGTNRGG